MKNVRLGSQALDECNNQMLASVKDVIDEEIRNKKIMFLKR